MGEVVVMVKCVGISPGRKKTRRPGWRWMVLLQVFCLLWLPESLYAQSGFCRSVDVQENGLLVTGEPCGQFTSAPTSVQLDSPHFSVSADPVNIALGGATGAFGIGLTALQNNPAGMAQVRQYAFSMGYGYHESPENHAFTVSATDSLINPHMSGGIMYTYHRVGSEIAGSQHHGSAQRVRAGMTLSERWQNWSFHLGAVGQLDDETVGRIDRNLWNFDVGVLLVGFQMLRLGGVIHRVLDQSDEGYPRRATGAVGFGTGPVQVEYDISARMDDTEDKNVSHAVGVQAAPMNQLPIRLGYHRQPSTDFQSVSGGLGYVFLQGGIDVSYAQELGGSHRRWVVAQFRMFLGN